MAPVMDFLKSDKAIGLIVKPARIGPETKICNLFVETMTARLAKQKSHYAIFSEPQLETGFPDIVIASFLPSVFDKWNSKRANLNIVDIKLLHHLNLSGGDSADNIERMLGLDSRNLVRSLERLLSANLISWQRKVWKPIQLQSAFGINKIIAIEVKIKNWAEALRQAEMNWWFASESYVLSPVMKPQKQVLEKADRLAVGVYSITSKGVIARIRSSKRERLPSSYASWLFNEWVGRRLYS